MPPNAANANQILQNNKRAREEDAADQRQAKREKSDDDSDEEMEIEDDEDDAPPKQETRESLSFSIGAVKSLSPLSQYLPQHLFPNKCSSPHQDCYVQTFRKR